MKMYLVVACSNLNDFEKQLNNPPDGYKVDNWNLANSLYLIVYKLWSIT